MRPENIGSFLEGIVEYKGFIEELKSSDRNFTLQSVRESIPFILAKLSIDLQRPLLVLTPKQDQAQQIYEQMQYWGARNVALFNETEVLPFERVSPDLQIGYQRISVLDALKDNLTDQVLVSSASAVMQKTVSPQDFTQSEIKLTIGGSHEFRSLIDLHENNRTIDILTVSKLIKGKNVAVEISYMTEKAFDFMQIITCIVC